MSKTCSLSWDGVKLADHRLQEEESGHIFPSTGKMYREGYRLQFPGVQMEDCLTWSSNTSELQRLFFLRGLKKKNICQRLLLSLYRSSRESILIFCIAVWFTEESPPKVRDSAHKTLSPLYCFKRRQHMLGTSRLGHTTVVQIDQSTHRSIDWLIDQSVSWSI